MDEQQLANQPVDPVAQAEEAPVDLAPESQSESVPEASAEPFPSVEDSPVSDAVSTPEDTTNTEETPSIPVDQANVFKTEYEALVAKTGYCLSVTPKPFKDDSGVYDTSKFTLEVTVAENK